jgi:hypothetical protein
VSARKFHQKPNGLMSTSLFTFDDQHPRIESRTSRLFNTADWAHLNLQIAIYRSMVQGPLLHRGDSFKNCDLSCRRRQLSPQCDAGRTLHLRARFVNCHRKLTRVCIAHFLHLCKSSLCILLPSGRQLAGPRRVSCVSATQHTTTVYASAFSCLVCLLLQRNLLRDPSLGGSVRCLLLGQSGARTLSLM